jgi:hypothetical protein
MLPPTCMRSFPFPSGAGGGVLPCVWKGVADKTTGPLHPCVARRASRFYSLAVVSSDVIIYMSADKPTRPMPLPAARGVVTKGQRLAMPRQNKALTPSQHGLVHACTEEVPSGVAWLLGRVAGASDDACCMMQRASGPRKAQETPKLPWYRSGSHSLTGKSNRPMVACAAGNAGFM